MTSTDRLPVSAFIICLNEADYLENCLRSLDQCAEIVVMDSGSTDGTLDLLARLTAEGLPLRVVHQDWLGYAGQKQAALEQCRQPWCLSIDADERLDAEARALLPEWIAAPAEIVGWRIARRPYLPGFGYTPRTVRERQNLRLIRRGAGSFDLQQRVHEGIVPTGRVRKTPRGSLLHYRPLPLDEQILKENKYSSLKADQKVAEGRPGSVVKLLISPPLYFIRLYLFNKLFLCGRAGLIQALTGAIYAALTEAKILQRHARRAHADRDDLDGGLG